MTTSENDNVKYRPSARQICLYYPNLIGYVRIILSIYGFWSGWQKNETGFLWFVLAMGTSQLLDIADGMVARAYNQCTLYGQILDMMVDRMSTVLSILLILRAVNDDIIIVALSFMLITDLSGHWINTLATCMIDSKASHKTVSDCDGLPGLELYYTNKLCMLTAHSSYEIFLMALYASIVASKYSHIWEIIIIATALPASFKCYTNAIQMIYGMRRLARFEDAMKNDKKLETSKTK